MCNSNSYIRVSYRTSVSPEKISFFTFPVIYYPRLSFLYCFPRVTITKCRKLGGLNNRKLSRNYGVQKSKIGSWQSRAPSEGAGKGPIHTSLPAPGRLRPSLAFNVSPALSLHVTLPCVSASLRGRAPIRKPAVVDEGPRCSSVTSSSMITSATTLFPKKATFSSWVFGLQHVFCWGRHNETLNITKGSLFLHRRLR